MAIVNPSPDESVPVDVVVGGAEVGVDVSLVAAATRGVAISRRAASSEN